MTAATAAVRRDGALLAVLGVVLVALSMRTAVGIIGAVFSAISDDLGLDVVVLSLLGAAPPVAFALAGLVVPALTRRWGLEASLLAAIVVIAAGQVLRAASGEAVLLVASTFLGVLGIGATNVLLPPIVRRYFPHRIGGVTALYLVLMSLSASIPAFVGVQLADALGWRLALAAWAVIPLLAVVPWIALLRVSRRADAPPAGAGTPPGEPEVPAGGVAVVRSPTAWAITAVLVLSSVSVYAALAFLPAILVESGGLQPAAAGAALGILLILGLPEALLVPVFHRHPRTVLPLIAFAGVCALAGWTGVLLAPAMAPFLWATLVGLVPITFPLALLLVNTRSRDPRTTVSLSGFVQGVAYVSAGVVTFALGVLHDVTGSWAPSLVLLAVSAGFAVPGIVILARRRFVDDEVATRDAVA